MKSTALAALALAAGTGYGGVTFQPLHGFGYVGPRGRLILATDGNLYGTTTSGGVGGWGTVFRATTNGTLTTIYTFTGGHDGANPYAGVIQAADGALYGTTCYGGDAGWGTIYRVTTNGVFTLLYVFPSINGAANPVAGLVQASDGALYGTTESPDAQTPGFGTIYRITTNGNFTVLYTFSDGTDGANPLAGLIQASDGNLYGTARYGGLAGAGTIFQITTNGTFTSLYSFINEADGAFPHRGLVQASDGNLYGTTRSGINYGTVFQFITNGTLTTLYAFSGGNDGEYPYDDLLQGPDGLLYGTTYGGGTNAAGTVFQISTKGAFTSLYSFTPGSDGANPVDGLVLGNDGNLYGANYTDGARAGGTIFRTTTNGLVTVVSSLPRGDNGANPYAGLVQATDGNFYGATFYGGASGNGVIFRLTPDGSLTNLYSFTGTNDGSNPYAGLVQASDGNLYGTTDWGGPAGAGTVFRLTTNGLLTTLYTFSGGTNASHPLGALVQGADGNLYGTTADPWGTIYQIATNGVFTSLYAFTGGSDGDFPEAGVIQANDGNFYGTTAFGPGPPWGTVFRLTPRGRETTFYSFSDLTLGANPFAGLVQASDGNLYGTTEYGPGGGTVFQLTLHGKFTLLHTFSGGDGAYPVASLIQASDGYLYGTTSQYGAYNYGTIFRISTAGALTTLYSFSGANDGANPSAVLVQGRDGNLYGTTLNGGASGAGTAFRLVLSAPVPPVAIGQPFISGGNFIFGFPTIVGQSYTVQQNASLATTNWLPYTNFIGNGGVFQVAIPITNSPAEFFRVREP